MALRFIDSFDDRSSANGSFKWNQASNQNQPLSTAYGRYGQGLYISSDGNQFIGLSLDTAQQTWIVGFAFKSELKYWPNSVIFRFYDINQIQCYVTFWQDGRARFYRGDGTLLLTSDPLLLTTSWQYFEAKIKVDNAAGSCDFRINSVACGSVAGVDTTTTANSYATEFRFQGGAQWFLDDFYICDGSGADTFRGDCRVETLLPDGAGGHTDWTPLAGNNYQAVDDPYSSAPCPDGDSTYVSSATPGNRDSYTYSNMTVTSGVVHGVQVSPNGMKTDAGARSLKPAVRIAATDYDGATKSLGGSYASYPELWVQNPNTVADWLIAGVNGAEFGIKDEA